MKKIFLIYCTLLSMISFGQVSQGGERKCGTEFSAIGLAGMTFSQALDFAGQTHNSYQDYLLNEISIIKPNFTDTAALKNIISGKSANYFASKGLNYEENNHSLNLAKPVTLELGLKVSNYSKEGYNIISQFQNSVKGYDPQADADFFTALGNLKKQALDLNNEMEVFTVGLPIAIAMHSYSYWKENGQKWMNLFSNAKDETDVGGPSYPAFDFPYLQKHTVDLWKLGGADVAGAIQGAALGSVGGFVGALAAGVLTSSVASLGNLVNQVISSYVKWWPF